MIKGKTMFKYSRPIFNILEELQLAEAKMDRWQSNNNSFKSGYTVREFTDLQHFLTACRPERLNTKIKNWPADFDIEFVQPKTLDRVQIGLHYPDATRAVFEMVIYKTEEVYNRHIRRGFKIKNPVYDAVKWSETRTKVAFKADQLYAKLKEVTTKLKNAGFRVLDPDEDFLKIIAAHKPYEPELEW